MSKEFGFQAIIRETNEELGIDINKKDILFLGSAISTNIKGDISNNHFNEFYIVNKDIDISKIILQKEEVSDAKWFDKDDIINKIKNNYDGITEKTGCWEYLIKYYEWIK